ncbi:DegT/DnrJ/EryC1/StrS family aminotransferase, partial [Candidatus Woesearchaeota archaeon]|nr:DegT/DnrJ/EryC1/StrS family aminotransferase [Candidatus Woesearchaeota archaeon]
MNLNLKPASEGGEPIRKKPLPYGMHWIEQDDIGGVLDTLKTGWLTTGPKVLEFEEAFKNYVGSKHAIALNSATAALHISLAAIGIKPGDEVITTPLTFCATSNAALYLGAKPVFADIKPDTLNINPAKIEEKITEKTKAIILMHYAGQPCDMDEIYEISKKYNLTVIEDASHAVWARYKGKNIGGLENSKTTCFSFHPVKNMTTAEGGIITTNDDEIAKRAFMLRLHGIAKDAWKRKSGAKVSAKYEMVDLGFKYNMSDIQASLGITQLKKLDRYEQLRTKIAEYYNKELKDIPGIELVKCKGDVRHAYHLYVIKINPEELKINRDKFIEALNAENIGTSIHYGLVYSHPFYQSLGYEK